MPPKKEGKKDDKKKQEDSAESRLTKEVKQLEVIRNDMLVEQQFINDKYRQMRAENERLRLDVESRKTMLSSATEDYADILEHRQEQIKAEETKLRNLQATIERLETDIRNLHEEIRTLKEVNAQQAARLDDAANLLEDKENLENAVRRQHELIEKQAEELKVLKKAAEEREAALDKATFQVEELTLKASATTELKILFEEPWLTQISHARLRGDMPLDRDGNTLVSLANGKVLVLYGGQVRSGVASHSDAAGGREVAVLSLETMAWEKPISARTTYPCHGHTSSVVGRTKVLVYGGVRGDAPTSEVSLLNTDAMKWMSPSLKGVMKPKPRWGHATCNIREKLFVFGGMDTEGGLLADIWYLDQDAMQWAELACFGTAPTARKGASFSASDDGRRLYLFGGSDGTKPLNDLHFLELERLTWVHVTTHIGALPEPREDHTATIISKYLIINGGWSATLGRRLGDTQVLDLYSPRWECLDDGAWAGNMSWLKQRACYSTFYGNKVFCVKPNMHEKLWELQILEFALPEDIERLRLAKRKEIDYSERLQLSDEATMTSTSAELSWRPPTKNSERVEKYKLMIATTTGVVKDVYQGRDTRFRVTGLKPNTEYVFCVKAIYDDGSFLWSESKAFTTKLSSS